MTSSSLYIILLILTVYMVYHLRNTKEPFQVVTLSTQGNLVGTNLDDILPRGMITMWAGAIGTDNKVLFNRNNVPAGWGLCDGSSYTYNGRTTSTPDLRGRFIRMYSDNADYDGQWFNSLVRLSGMNVPADIATNLGLNRDDKRSGIFKLSMGQYGGTDQLELREVEMPSHSHSINVKCAGSAKRGSAATGDNYCNSNENNQSTSGSGSGWSHNNVPPFYVLAYLMKL